MDRISPLFLLRLLHNLKPCMVRHSASMKGLHIKKEGVCDYDSWIYTQYDDPRRLDLNVWRMVNGLSHNVLWDVKGGHDAGNWRSISSSMDVNWFYDEIYQY